MKENRINAVLVRFSNSELELLEELKQRTKSTTYPRMIRAIVMNVALLESFDFLAQENIANSKGSSVAEEKLMMYELVESLTEQLQEQNIIFSGLREADKSGEEEGDQSE